MAKKYLDTLQEDTEAYFNSLGSNSAEFESLWRFFWSHESKIDPDHVYVPNRMDMVQAFAKWVYDWDGGTKDEPK